MWGGGYCLLPRGHVLRHSEKINCKYMVLFLISLEWTYLTCFDRYWLSSLWLLSTCLDMVLSADRLSSKFSILSFVACGGAIYSDNKLARSINRSRDLLILEQSVRFITRLSVWGCITTHKHVPVTGVKILSTCEWNTNPSGSGWILTVPPPSTSPYGAQWWRTRTATPAECNSFRERNNFRRSELFHTLPFNALVDVRWLRENVNRRSRPWVVV